jgi:hypothetical protein
MGRGGNMVEEFYLLDLERTIGMGRPFFWKRNRHGYTDALLMAGIFSRKEAEKIAQLDLNNLTILIEKKIVQRIFGKELVHEYTTP